MQFGDRNKKLFQVASTIKKKGKNTIWKAKDEYRNWFEDRNDILGP